MWFVRNVVLLAKVHGFGITSNCDPKLNCILRQRSNFEIEYLRVDQALPNGSLKRWDMWCLFGGVFCWCYVALERAE